MRIALLFLLLLISQFVFSQCPPGDIVLRGQADVDNFSVNYPGCTMLQGGLDIDQNNEGIRVDDLSGLSQIVSIAGDLSLSLDPVITSFTGLDNLQSIGGNFDIDFNYFFENSSREDFSGLGKLSFIGGDFIIIDMLTVVNLSGLDALTTVGGDFEISFNPELSSLTGLQGLTTVGGGLYIFLNNSLVDLSGLDNLNTVSGLYVSDNLKLESLNGLEKLTSVNDDFIEISFNQALTDISGIMNIDYQTVSDLNISQNAKLSDCAITLVCNSISFGLPNGIDINNNMDGCNSQTQVESFCNSLSTDENALQAGITIYPNPVGEKPMRILSLDRDIRKIEIHDLLGKKVFEISDSSSLKEVNISELRSGIYFCKLTDINKKSWSLKIVK